MQTRLWSARHRIGALAVTLMLAACFAEQTPEATRAALPGFWIGLWHGIIAPIAFVVSLFSDHVRIYAMPHAGRWYDFGFMLGIGGFTHGVSRGSRRRRVQRSDSDS
jgi:hypothetical protein